MNKKFFVFYVKPYDSYRTEMVTFDNEDQVSAFFASWKKNDPEIYRDPVVIFGTQCEFEPVEVVTKWRIKE